jgi:hypothetical protein
MSAGKTAALLRRMINIRRKTTWRRARIGKASPKNASGQAAEGLIHWLRIAPISGMTVKR